MDDVAVAEPVEAVAEGAGQAVASELEEAAQAILDAGDAGDDTAAVEPGDPAGEPVVSDEPPDLDSLLERYPHIRETLEQHDRDRENAGAQRERVRITREEGSRENSRERTRRIFQDIDPEGLLDLEEAVRTRDGRVVQRVDAIYAAAEMNAAVAVAQNLRDMLVGGDLPVPPEAFKQAEQIRDLPPEEGGGHAGYTKALWNASVQAEVAKLRADDEKRIRAEVVKRTQDELKAADIESKPRREPPPATPAGGGVGTALPYHQLTREQRNAMSASERDAYVARHGG